MLELTLQFDQSSYAPQAEVLATLRLTNASGQPQLVNARLALNSPGMPAAFRDVYLEFSQAPVPPIWSVMIRIGEPEEADFRTLAPGEAMEHRYPLRQYYDLPPGRYTVQAAYEN